MTNQEPALVIMAAGIGSRYGGLKQVDPIGPGGEIILDYAVYDALRAGFGKIIFIIRQEIADIFRERIGDTVERRVETVYVFQDLQHLPAGFSVPPGRTRPWGTGHAVLSAKGAIDRPFAVINADDFYGPQAFHALAAYLRQASDPPAGPYPYSMVGYILRNTLSPHGSVARGVCQVSADGFLRGIQERTRIQEVAGQVQYSEDGAHWAPLAGDAIVSMNMWGFTPSFVAELEARFPPFLQAAADPTRAEFFLPAVVNQLLEEGRAQVKVLPTGEKWFGVTHPDDRPFVQQAIAGLVRQGRYPEHLWA